MSAEDKKEQLVAPADSEKPLVDEVPVTEEPPKDAGLCPEVNAGWLSKITFMWLTSIFVKGWKRPLEAADMWTLGEKMQAQNLADRFAVVWAEQLKLKAEDDAAAKAAAEAKAKEDEGKVVVDTAGVDKKADGKKKGKKDKEPPSMEGVYLRRAIVKMFFWQFAPLGLIKLASDLCSVFSPLFVKYIIQYALPTNNSPIGEGIGLIIGLFLLQILATLLLNNYFQASIVVGISLRTSLTTTIYRKSLRLTSAARQEFNSGRVINLVSTDANRIEMFTQFCHVIWTAPIQILIIIAFLISQIGWAAIVGISLLLVLTPVQGMLWRKLSLIRRTVAPLTDKRVKTFSEILGGIRVIKFFAWEEPFLHRIEAIRRDEIAQVFKRAILNAFVMTIAFGIPVISGAIAFILYGYTNVYLDPSRIFSALTWFSQLRFPLMFLPSLISSWADVKVALGRIEALLLANEIEDAPAVEEGAPFALKIENGEFIWEALPAHLKDAANFKGPSGRPGGARGGPGGPAKKKMTWKERKAAKKQAAIEAKEKKEKESSTPASRRDSDETKNESEASPDAIEPAKKEAVPSKPTLRNINLEIPRGKLVAVVGAVGSGKSSLLNAIIGEMKRMQGSIVFSGSTGYAPQSAWIQNSTLKENITFGREFDQDRYLKVIRDCALEADLKVLPDGDQTSIGERGINLSGGQKQRVSLARCVYFGADTVLLDDPLSAVDAHVGRYLFDNCICGALKDKTRILVTHQLHFLPRVDYVIVMKDGEVAEQGTYQDLMDANGEFSTLIKNYGAQNEDDMEVSKASDGTAEEEKDKLDKLGKTLAARGNVPGKDIMQVEDRATGTVSGRVWWSYMMASGGVMFLILLVSSLAFVQVTRIGNDLWLVWWSQDQFKGTFNLAGYIGVYAAWGIVQSFATYLSGIVFAFTGTRAARVLHEAAAARILRAPVNFFDTTPLGRIVNRFSKDQDGVDNTLADSFRMFTSTLASSLSTFVLICYATPFFMVPMFPLLGIYYFMQLIYRATSRELKRLDSVTRSPLYANFGETLTGLATIKAYREQHRFINNNDAATNANNAPYFLLVTAQRWLGLRLETLGSILVFFAALFGILAKDKISPGLLGLSLSYALQVTQILNWCIRQFTDTEIAMNAVERIEHYAYKLDTEAPAVLPQNRPPPEWPVTGNIRFENVEMRYAPDLPLVLKGVSFEIKDRQKIGIVGRTGSGKSSLMQALFRMVEPAAGRIIIDGLDSREMGLKDLRSGLAIIPQDPILFTGSYRSNLDPFSLYSDADLWDALSRAGLKSKVMETEEKLDGAVSEGGENLSVGQRQLLCLARAMLKKPRILILDEATANIDMPTDALIQKALREDFKDATVLTIAHRLNTIIDYDMVMVLDQGTLAEYDSPHNLLTTENSRFSSMINETGAANAELLRSLAETAAHSTGEGMKISLSALALDKDLHVPGDTTPAPTTDLPEDFGFGDLHLTGLEDAEEDFAGGQYEDVVVGVLALDLYIGLFMGEGSWYVGGGRVEYGGGDVFSGLILGTVVEVEFRNLKRWVDVAQADVLTSKTRTASLRSFRKSKVEDPFPEARSQPWPR
ncbi:hypothetical protein HDV05_008472 [Chytridiales sp. JEL 0842]|nr:hypothetical protein HDV05_008472 [Chytridiales sp. JEL 0842]